MGFKQREIVKYKEIKRAEVTKPQGGGGGKKDEREVTKKERRERGPMIGGKKRIAKDKIRQKTLGGDEGQVSGSELPWTRRGPTRKADDRKSAGGRKDETK